MGERIRNRTAIVIAALSLVLGVQALLAPQIAFTGITLRRDLRPDGPVLVVAAVDPASRAHGLIQPGTIVQEVNYSPWMVIPDKWLDAYLRGDFVELGVPLPAGGLATYTFPAIDAKPIGFVFLVGIGLLFGILAWVRRGLAGEALRPLAFPLAVATATPLIVVPTSVSPSWVIAIVAVAMTVFALLVLANGWVGRVEERTRRRVAIAIALAAAVGYLALELILLSVESWRPPFPGGWLLFVVAQELPPHVGALLGALVRGLAPVLAAAVTVVPALTLLISSHRGRGTAVASGGARSSDRLPILLAALTPVVVATTYGFGGVGFGLSIPLIWLLVVVFVLQTNARAETMRTQMDMVVAATEVERARLAADLHDEALQEMTVLVRRLDDTGDERAAALARSIADRMRDVCGDLRLPVLDELGAGAALEWLVARVGESWGGQVRLERNDGSRPPADVELAVFRVAQEALANAVTHGAPPIIVRYSAASDHASLSITDQGAGIAPDAAADAARSGHYGLLNMRQRAEQIGARIDVRRPPDGGTSIGLSWSSP